jgi:hypothetical protein
VDRVKLAAAGVLVHETVGALIEMSKDRPMPERSPRGQLLHLVFGGELTELDRTEFKDPDRLDIVGIYPNYATAYVAWKAKAQQTVDNAHMRYFIVHLHRLLAPDADQPVGR